MEGSLGLEGSAVLVQLGRKSYGRVKLHLMARSCMVVVKADRRLGFVPVGSGMIVRRVVILGILLSFGKVLLRLQSLDSM